MTIGQFLVLNKNSFAITVKLKQISKRVDISIHAHITKSVDLEDIAKGNLEKRMNNLMSDGKVINKTNHNKNSYPINLDLINIATESTLNFSHDVIIPNTDNAANVDVLSSSTNH